MEKKEKLFDFMLLSNNYKTPPAKVALIYTAHLPQKYYQTNLPKKVKNRSQMKSKKMSDIQLL